MTELQNIDKDIKILTKELEGKLYSEEEYVLTKNKKKLLEEKVFYLSNTKMDLIDRVEVLEKKSKDIQLTEHLINYQFLIQLEIDRFEELIDIEGKKIKNIEGLKKDVWGKKNKLSNIIKVKLDLILSLVGEDSYFEKQIEKIQYSKETVKSLKDIFQQIDSITDYLDASIIDLELLKNMCFLRRCFYMRKENPYVKINGYFKESREYLNKLNIQDMIDLEIIIMDKNLIELALDVDMIDECLTKSNYYRQVMKDYKYNIGKRVEDEEKVLSMLKSELKQKIIEYK